MILNELFIHWHSRPPFTHRIAARIAILALYLTCSVPKYWTPLAWGTAYRSSRYPKPKYLNICFRLYKRSWGQYGFINCIINTACFGSLLLSTSIFPVSIVPCDNLGLKFVDCWGMLCCVQHNHRLHVMDTQYAAATVPSTCNIQNTIAWSGMHKRAGTLLKANSLSIRLETLSCICWDGNYSLTFKWIDITVTFVGSCKTTETCATGC